MSDERTSFIKTPKQLVIVVALAFAVPIVLFALLSQLITGVRPAGSQEAETGVLNRIKPVGEQRERTSCWSKHVTFPRRRHGIEPTCLQT